MPSASIPPSSHRRPATPDDAPPGGRAGVRIGHGWAPGIVGEVVRAHAVYYAREWSFGPVFEAKVAREMAAFLDRYDAARDRLFHAAAAGRFVGSLTIDGSDPALPSGRSHLRWFVVTDEARGRGVGRGLMQAALAFVRQAGFRSCFLTTFAGLDPARRLYDEAGFVLAEETAAETWGTRVVEQRFTLDLAAARDA